MKKDRFSSHSLAYATFRPTYPTALYEEILRRVRERHLAWDCATGNGQVAKDLSPYFRKICATDISANQLAHAFPRENIEYFVCAAEETPFPENSFDLITVAQALHWLDLTKFFSEVRRVARPDAIVAAWGYGLLRVNAELDPVIDDFYVNIVGPYWDKERRHIDDRFGSIPFPFERWVLPELEFSFRWTLDELKGYLSTWSAVRKYTHERGEDPVAPCIKRLGAFWREQRYEVRFPLFTLAGVVRK